MSSNDNNKGMGEEEAQKLFQAAIKGLKPIAEELEMRTGCRVCIVLAHVNNKIDNASNSGWVVSSSKDANMEEARAIAYELAYCAANMFYDYEDQPEWKKKK